MELDRFDKTSIESFRRRTKNKQHFLMTLISRQVILYLLNTLFLRSISWMKLGWRSKVDLLRHYKYVTGRKRPKIGSGSLMIFFLGHGRSAVLRAGSTRLPGV